MTTEHYTSVYRAMFRTDFYSDANGVRPPGRECTPDTHVVSVYEWALTIQEKAPSGAWGLIFWQTFWRKADAVEAAEKMGASPDYVSHHADDIDSIWLGGVRL